MFLNRFTVLSTLRVYSRETVSLVTMQDVTVDFRNMWDKYRLFGRGVLDLIIGGWQL